MTERLRFVCDARRRIASFTELCQHYGISRVTGYKWLPRWGPRKLLKVLRRRDRREGAASTGPRGALWRISFAGMGSSRPGGDAASRVIRAGRSAR